MIRCSDEKVDIVLKDLLPNIEERRNFTLGLRMFPDVEVRYCARTYDEEEIYLNDMVTISIIVKRLKEPWNHNPDYNPVMEPPERKEKQGNRKDYTSSDGLSFVDSSEKKGSINIKTYNSPIVHTLYYPFQMREKWVALLYGSQISAVLTKAIPALVDSEKLDFVVPARRVGKHTLTFQLTCDSYYGLDIKRTITFNVKNKPEEKEEIEEEDSDYDIPEEVDEEPEAYWYYLGGENVWEFLLTIFLLYFLYLIVISSSYGQKYVQPYVDLLLEYCSPIWNQHVNPVIESMISTIQSLKLQQYFDFTFEEEMEDDFIERDEL